VVRKSGEKRRDGIIILTEGLRKDYVLGADTVRAVRGVDLTIQMGEFVSMIGASG
jgi:putative ABC transport system ATP-binding protein